MSKDSKKKVKSTEKVKNPKVDSKLIDKSKTAQKELETYLKANKLDPTKDWTKDKKHGAKVKELLSVVNASRDKIKEATPAEQHHKKSDDKKPKTASKAVKYDYPQVDGREMTSGEKKKYRVKMRSSSTTASKADKVKAKDTIAKPSEKKSDKTKTAVVAEKKVEKSDKKSAGKKGNKKISKKVKED